MEFNNESIFYEKLLLTYNKGKILKNEPMNIHTTFRLGGIADYLTIPCSEEEVCNTILLCRENKIPFMIIGNGSNLIVRDGGIRGVVIKMSECMSEININGEIIEAQSGVLLSSLSKKAYDAGLGGLEFAEGIPGTLGGAVIMNAGAYTGEMKDVVVKTRYSDMQGNIFVIEGEQHQFGYRKSIIQNNNGIVMKSWLKLTKKDKNRIKEEMDTYSQKRREKQPLEMPSAGSVFKRPIGNFAGKLIEESGLRGFSIGGAQISEKHCGFIVNKGNATAKDVLQLISHIKNTVYSNSGVMLETEVKVVGEE